MELNITLILQMLQFGCAYYFLYRFLFAPAYKILDENEKAKHELYKNLEQEQQLKDRLLHDFYAKSKLCKTELLDVIPEKATQGLYEVSSFVAPSYHLDKVILSEQDRKQAEMFLIDHLSQVIKK